MQTYLLKSRLAIPQNIKRAAPITLVAFIIAACLHDLHCILTAKGGLFITYLPFLLLLVESALAIRIIMIYLQGNVNASQVPLVQGNQFGIVYSSPVDSPDGIRQHNLDSVLKRERRLELQELVMWNYQKQFLSFFLRMWHLFHLCHRRCKEPKFIVAHLDP